jgi:signal transduction histidine kinase
MMTLMVILFMAGIFFLNRFIFRNLWKDFFDALDKLKHFDTTKEPVTLGEPDVEEFVELKKVLERMTLHLSSEYRELKEYTDHTTHELQTPLAVIKTKTELLMQSANLGPEEMQLLQSINASVNHLSRLNSTLATITRIENQQFTGKEELRLADLVEKHLEMFQELIELRGLQVEQSYDETVKVLTMDKGLADILVTNLLKNAIVHNEDGGRILCRVRGGMLELGNSGKALGFHKKELFRRFVRDTSKTGNFGLGLSLVKKICDHYGFEISYEYQDQMHFFRIIFD